MSAISQRLDLRQSQNLVMTPQLQQAIKLLQLSNAELAEYIEGEIAQNPLLEKQSSDQSAEAQDNAGTAEQSDNVQNDFDESWTGNEADRKEKSSDFDPGAAQYGTGGNQHFDALDESFESSLSTRETLRDHLIEQINIAFSDGRDRIAASLMCDMLDEAGYLRDSLDEIAAKLGGSGKDIDRILTRLKGFSPSGVFARDLKECLAIQLGEQGRLDPPMERLLDNLHLLAGHNLSELSKKCDVNAAYLADMVAELRTLNPKPSSNFDHLVVQTAIPDILMKKMPKNLGGGWKVELNAETLPRVLVNNEYYTLVSEGAKEKKDREYISTQLNNANWLIKSLDQRAQTILKVASEIVEQQEAFFLFGIEFLKPLTLNDIAEAIGMHESTVSRVSTNKYIGTPRGIFELKYFFSTALVSADGVSHSSESIKARLKAMVDAEEPSDILSDDDIVDLMKKEGIDIARRTVAKYRDLLNIPSSVQRRRQKAAAL